ncbi:hypothetical protein VN12_01680 [Pirellula sp. SH-Sr6A]|uniref:YicC/YloC family endoribonuclease n=1 Tax=Pirellula sp. SH-Sr6A TaxID=1632865 RepID=UPI00078EAB83|nr:YicC/YloC family endoribonuclease [Pirellula sp. SH-Sr6A]AMV30796.1 hypothetical protein VN12_01680 [Pirellula sp. SH-Sr6A]
MLLSMTGHGESSKRLGGYAIEVEIRTVNNRFLKILTKLSDLAAPLESDLEGLVRDFLKRGSVSLYVRVTSSDVEESAFVNQPVLQAYLRAAKEAADAMLLPFHPDVSGFMALPGVLDTPKPGDNPELEQGIREACAEALQDLQAMRRAEGEAMSNKFQEYLRDLRSLRDSISRRAPQVVLDYQTKLEQRIRTACESRGLDLESSEFVREVALFCDKADISEELTRLESHFHQFETVLRASESQGRKLDFLVQELGRETNTIGSKANDAEISVCVVSMKTILEQIRELVQNIE